jgi:hypothetical protein
MISDDQILCASPATLNRHMFGMVVMRAPPIVRRKLRRTVIRKGAADVGRDG